METNPSDYNNRNKKISIHIYQSRFRYMKQLLTIHWELYLLTYGNHPVSIAIYI